MARGRLHTLAPGWHRVFGRDGQEYWKNSVTHAVSRQTPPSAQPLLEQQERQPAPPGGLPQPPQGARSRTGRAAPRGRRMRLKGSQKLERGL